MDRESVRAVVRTISLSEQRQAALIAGPSPLFWQFRDALIEGIRGALDSAVSTGLLLMRVLPSLALWALVLVPPAVLIRRRYRRRAEV